MSNLKVHSPEEVQTLLRLCKETHKDKRPLPPEIVEKKQQIEAATRNAELFTARLRQVDQGMINDIVLMKRELDTLYSRWIQEETPRLH